MCVCVTLYLSVFQCISWTISMLLNDVSMYMRTGESVYVTPSIPAVLRLQSQRSESVCQVRLSRKAAATNSAPDVGAGVAWVGDASFIFMFKRYQKHSKGKTTWLMKRTAKHVNILQQNTLTSTSKIEEPPKELRGSTGPHHPLLHLCMSLRLPPLWLQQRMQLVCPAISYSNCDGRWRCSSSTWGFPIDMSAYRRDARSSSSDQCQH